jgi:hypothetical protein
MNDFSKLNAEDDISRLAQISSEEVREVSGETDNQGRTEMHAKLCNWLTECKCHDVKPVNVRIGDEIWVGCYYKRTLEYTASMDAVTRGDKKAGDTYTEESIYCLGKLPKAKLKRNKPNPSAAVCFPYNGHDWYIAAYMPKENLHEGNASFHPFGISFILRPWDIPNSKIDDYERKPYTRQEMRVSFL